MDTTLSEAGSVWQLWLVYLFNKENDNIIMYRIISRNWVYSFLYPSLKWTWLFDIHSCWHSLLLTYSFPTNHASQIIVNPTVERSKNCFSKETQTELQMSMTRWSVTLLSPIVGGHQQPVKVKRGPNCQGPFASIWINPFVRDVLMLAI